MHLTRRILESKRLLAIFGSLNTQKPLPFIHQVSPTHPFHYSTIYADVYSKSQINNAITLHFSRTMQERWCFERPFSSKPSEDNGIKISNTAEDEDCELICQVINQTKWSEKTETELSSLNIKLSASIVLSVLETLEKNPETALNFFKWASTQDFSHTASTYNTVIGILGQKSCIDQFWNIVAEMTNYGHQMDMKTYQKVLRRFLNNKLMEDAVGLFVLKIGSTENKPSRQDFKMILHNLSLSSSPDIDLVYRVVETFENGNDKFDKTIYDDIHRCLTIAGRFDEAIGVMKTMEEEGFVPDNDTYSQLVFGLCKAGTLDEACRVLDAMKELGCTPNLKTWSILIDGHCRAGEIDGAVSCFELMLESGCNANQEILGTLVDSLCSQNRIEDAHSFLCKMIEKKDLKPSRPTLKKLLLKLISAEKLPEATKLSDLMMNQGFPAIVDPFYKIFAKSGTVDGAVDFLNKATKNRPRYLAVKVYFSMLNAFCEAGKQAYASKLLYKCPRHIQRNPDLLFQFGSVDTQHLKDTNPKKKIKSAKVL